jgi:citrate synthase
MIEQLAETKITRPESIYVGPHDLKWQPRDQRS